MSVTNSIDLDRDPRSITGTRMFDAPRELAWQAWADSKHLAQTMARLADYTVTLKQQH